MYRSTQRGGYNEFFMEPTTPPRRKNGDDSPNEFSPGLLDLHSFDTELLPEVGLWNFDGRKIGKVAAFCIFGLSYLSVISCI